MTGLQLRKIGKNHDTYLVASLPLTGVFSIAFLSYLDWWGVLLGLIEWGYRICVVKSCNDLKGWLTIFLGFRQLQPLPPLFFFPFSFKKRASLPLTKGASSFFLKCIGQCCRFLVPLVQDYEILIPLLKMSHPESYFRYVATASLK